MNDQMELLPSKAIYRAGEEAHVELRGAMGEGDLTVWHFDRIVAQTHEVADIVSVGVLPPGGYAIEWTDGTETCRTAVQVLSASDTRLRYGFVVDYTPGRDVAGVIDNVRRLHLNALQFYDWAYRHADLTGGGDTYSDALGQPVSLETVRRMIGALHDVGSDALGYAAVYAVGGGEWEQWAHDGLLAPSGVPYGLADFLKIVDPAAPDWLEHFGTDLAVALAELGFDGFHLDQYGYPKRAQRADGELVDVAASFETLISSVRDRLPHARLVFNNVNDFPTWVTAHSRQDAVYIEVWEPHTTLSSLAAVATRARSLAGGKPVVIAAYQHVYDIADAQSADRATALTMAALYTHGATQLLAGEADRVLVDPYYVRNHRAGASTQALLKRWYDFATAHDEILFASDIHDVTGSYAGTYNGDLDVSFGTARCTEECTAGAVWRGIRSTPQGLVVHLVNMIDQTDTLWDSPRAPISARPSGTLRYRATAGTDVTISVADPDDRGRLITVPQTRDGDHVVALLPSLNVWQLILIAERPVQE